MERRPRAGRDAEDYGAAAFNLAFAFQSNGADKRCAAEQLYRTAIRLAPNLAASYKNLGLLLHDHGGDPRELRAVWGGTRRLSPHDPQAGSIRDALMARKG